MAIFWRVVVSNNQVRYVGCEVVFVGAAEFNNSLVYFSLRISSLVLVLGFAWYWQNIHEPLAQLGYSCSKLLLHEVVQKDRGHDHCRRLKRTT